jgi:hypothetical protein
MTDRNFIKVHGLTRKNSAKGAKTTESSTTTTTSGGGADHSRSSSSLNERSPLVSHASPLPLVAKGRHCVDLVNAYNLEERVQRQIGERLGHARALDLPICVIFAFTIVGGGATPTEQPQCRIVDSDAFEQDTDNVLQLSAQGQCITLDQLCLDLAGRFPKVYKEVVAVVRHIRQAEPQVHLILQKKTFKQRNQAPFSFNSMREWYARVTTPLLHGDYYCIVGDFAQAHCH